MPGGRPLTLPRRVPALVLALLLTLVGLPAPSAHARPLGSPASSPAAGPATTAAGVSVGLSSVSPVVAGPADPVTVTVTVRNDESGPLTGATLNVLRGGTRVTTQEAVGAWADDTTPATGRVLASAPVPDVAPGASVSVSTTIAAGAQLSDRAYDVVPVSLEVAGAVTHTFLGMQRAKEYEPLSLAWLLPLTLDPDPGLHAAPSADRWARWRALLGPDGRIGRTLTSFAGSDVTYAVDAGLVLDPPSTGGATSGPTTAPSTSASPATPGSPSPAASTPSTPSTKSTPSSASPLPSDEQLDRLGPITAERLVRSAAATRLRSALDGHPVLVLPAGDPDVQAVGDGALARATVEEATARAARAATLLEARADVVWPADTHWGTGVSDAMRAAAVGGRPTVITDRAGLAWRLDQGGAGRRALDGTPLLVRDAALGAAASTAVAATPGSPGAAAGTQEFLAQSFALLQESPGLARTVLVAPNRGFDPQPDRTKALLGAIGSIPWLTSSTVAAELEEAASAASVAESRAGVEATASASPLDAATRSTLDELTVAARSAASIRRDEENIGTDWQSRLAALLGTRWRDHGPDFTTVLDGLRAEVAASTNAVTVAPQTINFLADSGRVQVTVLNDLDVGVDDVRVRLVPANPRLRIDDDTKSVSIGPRSRATVTYRATALASGPVEVTAQVTGPDGMPAGPSTRMHVRVTPTGAVAYWVLGAIILVVFALGLWRNQRARRSRDAEPDPANAIRLDEDGRVVETSHVEQESEVHGG